MAMPTQGTDEYYVSSLFVDSKFRDNGLGTRLLNRVFLLFTSREGTHPCDVKDDKPYLVSLLHQTRFQEKRIVRDYYSDGSSRLIMLRLKK